MLATQMGKLGRGDLGRGLSGVSLDHGCCWRAGVEQTASKTKQGLGGEPELEKHIWESSVCRAGNSESRLERMSNLHIHVGECGHTPGE